MTDQTLPDRLAALDEEVRGRDRSACLANEWRIVVEKRLVAALARIAALEAEVRTVTLQRNAEEEAAMHSGGILSDVADILYGDTTRAETHGYRGVKTRARNVVREVKRQRSQIGELKTVARICHERIAALEAQVAEAREWAAGFKANMLHLEKENVALEARLALAAECAGLKDSRIDRLERQVVALSCHGAGTVPPEAPHE